MKFNELDEVKIISTGDIGFVEELNEDGTILVNIDSFSSSYDEDELELTQHPVQN